MSNDWQKLLRHVLCMRHSISPISSLSSWFTLSVAKSSNTNLILSKNPRCLTFLGAVATKSTKPYLELATKCVREHSFKRGLMAIALSAWCTLVTRLCRSDTSCDCIAKARKKTLALQLSFFAHSDNNVSHEINWQLLAIWDAAHEMSPGEEKTRVSILFSFCSLPFFFCSFLRIAISIKRINRANVRGAFYRMVFAHQYSEKDGLGLIVNGSVAVARSIICVPTLMSQSIVIHRPSEGNATKRNFFENKNVCRMRQICFL